MRRGSESGSWLTDPGLRHKTSLVTSTQVFCRTVFAAVPTVRVLHQPTRAIRHVNHVKKELWCKYHV